MPPSRIAHIDVWRCIAVTLVVIYHVVYFSHPWYKAHVPALVAWMQANGVLGVQIFFCISGFVICRGLAGETRRTGRVSMRAFFIRRAYRILPPLALYIAFAIAGKALHVLDPGMMLAVRAAFFTCNMYAFGGCGYALGHTWSLAYEEQFYLAFPFLLVLLGLVARPRRLLWILLLLAAAFVPLAAGGAHPLVTPFFINFAYLLAGCACALYWDALAPLLARLPAPAWLAGVVAMLGLNLLPLPADIKSWLVPLALPPLICLSVFGTPMHDARARAVFSQPVLAYVGRMSYSIYLWQQAATYDYGFASPLPGLGLLLGALVLAHLSYTYFELPLIARGAARAQRAAQARGDAYSLVS